MNTGRTQDIQELLKAAHFERDPERKRNIMRTIQILKNETGAIRSMREALVKAHRNNDTKEIKDIHDFIERKEKYKNASY